MRALKLGKHVLVEKPMANTAAEAQYLIDLAEKKGVVLLEAIHWRSVGSSMRAAPDLTIRDQVSTHLHKELNRS